MEGEEVTISVDMLNDVEFKPVKPWIDNITNVEMLISEDPNRRGCFMVHMSHNWWSGSRTQNTIWTDGEDLWKSMGECILSPYDTNLILKAIEDYCEEIG